MKENQVLQFWNGIFPFLIFYALAYFSTYGLIGLFSEVEPMVMQGVAQIIFIASMMVWLKNKQKKDKIMEELIKSDLLEKKGIHQGRYLQFPKQKMIIVFCVMVISMLFSMALNQLIDASNLKELSPAFQAVSSSIYEPGKIQILICVGLIAPAYEELMFRGILFGQLRKSYSFLFCAVTSGLIFGGLHLNLVQFVYAFAMGYLFAFFMEESGSVWFSIIAHVVANITSLMTTWLGSASWMFDHVLLSLVVAFVEGIVGIMLLNWIKKRFKLLK